MSRSKHKEFESNSALQIRDQKERRVENTKEMEYGKNFAGLRKEFLHPANFCILQIFASCEISQHPAKLLPLPLVIALATVHPALFLPAARFCFLFSFWFSSYFLLVIVFIFVVFGNLYYGLAIKDP